jgi:hypothetical protein
MVSMAELRKGTKFISHPCNMLIRRRRKRQVRGFNENAIRYNV